MYKVIISLMFICLGSFSFAETASVVNSEPVSVSEMRQLQKIRFQIYKNQMDPNEFNRLSKDCLESDDSGNVHNNNSEECRQFRRNYVNENGEMLWLIEG